MSAEEEVPESVEGPSLRDGEIAVFGAVLLVGAEQGVWAGREAVAGLGVSVEQDVLVV